MFGTRYSYFLFPNKNNPIIYLVFCKSTTLLYVSILHSQQFTLMSNIENLNVNCNLRYLWLKKNNRNTGTEAAWNSLHQNLKACNTASQKYCIKHEHTYQPNKHFVENMNKYQYQYNKTISQIIYQSL